MAGDIATLDCAALPDHEVVAVCGREAMNTLPVWSVDILVPEWVDLDPVLRAAATLRLRDEAESSERTIGLVVTGFTHAGATRDGHRYVVSLSAPEWLLTRRSGYRVFVEKTTKEIVESLLTEGGTPPDRLVWRLGASYMRRVQSVQYAEPEWGYIERLLADEGIAYWFDFDADKGPTLVFGDDPGAHDGILAPDVVPFEDASGMVAVRHFFVLALRERMAPTASHVRDFDVRQPDLFVEGRAGEGPLEVFEYPAGVLTKDAAALRAKVRLEQHQRHRVVATGQSDCVRVQPGRVLAIEGCADELGNRQYLVTEVTHDYRRPAPHEDAPRSYRNRVTMVPATRAHRPSVPRTAPRVPGFETALTTGPAGEEIHVDDLARVKLRFFWDRSGIGDDRSSWWSRTMQMNMGGSMLLPRVGWEVPVAFMHGNPDAPIVLGRVYNGAQVVPYALPEAAATTSLQSASSPGGGSTNEIRMGDTMGSMEMFVHASRDQSVTVGGAAKTTVGANETHDVGLSHAVTVGGAHAHTVGGAQSVNVGTDHALSVKGGRTDAIAGKESVEVKGNRSVSTGGYTELVGGFYNLRCNQMNTSVSGAFLQLVGGALGTVAGLGLGESIAAARTELVAGRRTILAGKCVEEVTGVHNVSAGTASDKAGAKVVTIAKGAGRVHAGSLKSTAGGPIVLSAPTISIDVAGSINAGALSLGGGTLKATKGTTKLKGTIKRQGATKIE